MGNERCPGCAGGEPHQTPVPVKAAETAADLAQRVSPDMMQGFRRALVSRGDQAAKPDEDVVGPEQLEGDPRRPTPGVAPDMDHLLRIPTSPTPPLPVHRVTLREIGLVWLPDVFLPSLGSTVGDLRLTPPRLMTIAGCPQEEATIELKADGESASDWLQPPTFGLKEDNETIYVVDIGPWDKKGRGPKSYEQQGPNKFAAYAVMRVEVIVRLSGAEPEKGKEEECCCIESVKRYVKKIKPEPKPEDKGKWLDDFPKKEPAKKGEKATLQDREERVRLQEAYVWDTYYRSKSCKKWVIGDTPGRLFDKRLKDDNKAQYEFESIFKVVATFKGKGCPKPMESYYRVKLALNEDGSFKKDPTEAKPISKEEAEKAK